MLLDRLITLLGLPGILLMARREPRLALAGGVTLLFLLLWPTKWPQYEVVLLPWLCIGAEVTAGSLVRLVARLVTLRRRGRGAITWML